MNANGILRKHWLHAAFHFATDAVLFAVALGIGFLLRFGHQAIEQSSPAKDAPSMIATAPDGATDPVFEPVSGDFSSARQDAAAAIQARASLRDNWPFLVLAALVFSLATYITGLYSTHSANQGYSRRALILAGTTLIALLVLVGLTYGIDVRPLGRGVVSLGGATAYALVLVHHAFLLHALRSAGERVVYLVTSAFDEAEMRLLASFGGRSLQLIGVVTACGYQPKGDCRVLGSVAELEEIVHRERIHRVLCTSKNLSNAQLTSQFCKLRYSGVTVMPLIILCEEIEQYVPLELVSHEWLLNASGEPHLLYIKKIKRLFDVVASTAGLILGAPLLALGAVAIKLTSPGPIFYRQTRNGRFGHTFRMTKLRTMHIDAEKGGVQWSGKNDPRIHPIGQFLRKYRIDEIPQLWHVLCGRMSFVGPRPERPEIVTELAKQIPFYEERLMVQPGITGWAQVSYPYGASALDARRKLEYDLYYMKHMSLSLDVFILLDTVRTILSGGASAAQDRSTSNSEVILEWERLKDAEAKHAPKLELEPV
jgi:exopolysaccharide biosynthesis polyprenyl glycosylphosphotransferase